MSAHSCHENISSPTNEIRAVCTDRQTVYDLSCRENILSPTNKIQFTDRKKFFTDRISLLRSVRSVRIDKPYMTSLAMKILQVPLMRCNLRTVYHFCDLYGLYGSTNRICPLLPLMRFSLRTVNGPLRTVCHF